MIEVKCEVVLAILEQKLAALKFMQDRDLKGASRTFTEINEAVIRQCIKDLKGALGDLADSEFETEE